MEQVQMIPQSLHWKKELSPGWEHSGKGEAGLPYFDSVSTEMGERQQAGEQIAESLASKWELKS